MKHGLWLQLLSQLTDTRRPITVLDTHAGAGLYPLDGAMAQRSGEAEQGVLRLMGEVSTPRVFEALKLAVASENIGSPLRFYPGSPLLTLGALRTGDDYLGCELRPDDCQALADLLQRRTHPGGPGARALHADGYGELCRSGARQGVRTVAIVDPPYERGDEREQVLAGIGAALATGGSATIALWAPIKDLESLDAILRGLEDLRPERLQVAEVRLRPLSDPMRMNGSAMVFINAPDLEADAMAACTWLARVCGEGGAAARFRTLTL